jgi:hypothetical protein
MTEQKRLEISALEHMRGDNLRRARAAFRNCTPKEMGEQYGQSGKTRAEMLAEYEAHEAKVNAAIAWVMAR